MGFEFDLAWAMDSYPLEAGAGHCHPAAGQGERPLHILGGPGHSVMFVGSSVLYFSRARATVGVQGPSPVVI